MTLRQFINKHKDEIDKICNLPKGYRNYNERRLWVLNDESLYNWARSEGVKI